MDLLVSLRDLAALIDPQDRVFDLAGIDTRLVDADMDGQLLATGFLLQPKNKLAVMRRLDEPHSLLRGPGDIVACFGEEERLAGPLSEMLLAAGPVCH